MITPRAHWRAPEAAPPDEDHGDGGPGNEPSPTPPVVDPGIWMALLSDIAGDEIADALTSLAEAGVAIIEGEQVWASSATRRLDHLDLICV